MEIEFELGKQGLCTINTMDELNKIIDSVMLLELLKLFIYINYKGLPVRRYIKFQGNYLRIKLPLPLNNESEQAYCERTKIERGQIRKQLIRNIITISDQKEFQQISICDNDPFSGREFKILQNNIETIFEDDEVQRIADKLNHPHVRFIRKKDFNEHRAELHEIIMKYYQIYGGNILSFLLRIPKIEFSKKDCYEIKDFRQGSFLLPKLVFKKKTEDEILFCFYPPISTGETCSIFNKAKKSVGKLYKSGILQSTNSLFSADLTFYINPVSGQVYSGTEYNNCIFCNHIIDTPSSIKWGYGPICAQNFYLPYD